MPDGLSVLELLPTLHREASRILPHRFHGRIRPSDLAQTTAQILLRSKISKISCIVSWSRGIIRKLIAKALSREASLRNHQAVILSSRAIGRQGAIEESIAAPHVLTADDSFPDMMQAARLDGTDKKILQLYFVEGETMRTIATATGLPLSTIHNRFRQALEQVREACDAGARPA